MTSYRRLGSGRRVLLAISIVRVLILSSEKEGFDLILSGIRECVGSSPRDLFGSVEYS